MMTVRCAFQPLRVNVDDAIISNIDQILQYKHDKEDMMRSIFQLSRHIAQNEISELLADFRNKRALGQPLPLPSLIIYTLFYSSCTPPLPSSQPPCLPLYPCIPPLPSSSSIILTLLSAMISLHPSFFIVFPRFSPGLWLCPISPVADALSSHLLSPLPFTLPTYLLFYNK